MKAGLALAAGAVAFVVVATANSGGYRYGISDQAFYIPAIAHATDPALLPRDATLLAPQMQLWAGDEILGFVLRTLPIGMPALFVVLYIAGLLLLFTAGVYFARGLGASWLAVAAAVALLTLRHRIAKTGANSLEGYMHPRMIAFALGLLGLGFLLRKRWGGAIAFVALAAVVHPTTAVWFGAVVGFAFVLGLTPKLRAGLLGAAALVTVGYLLTTPRMDATWLAVLGEKDYLFSHQWPPYAWVANLLYGLVLILLYRRRASTLEASGERAVVGGLLLLVAVFLVSVPLAAMQIAPVVQLQVNRVFWLLDAVALIYVAWWLVDYLSSHWRLRVAVAGFIVALACGRGVFILTDTGRAFATLDLASGEWTDAMRWLRSQPVEWQVLADPGHAWKYGTSVRAAALRDTVIEQSKDSAMAMYGREVARRIADRTASVSGFHDFSEEQYRAVGRKYDARILILERPRELTLPRLYENPRFTIYDLK